MNIATTASVATAVITTIIAALIALITWRQWITNRARLRHELFDRRYTIFEQLAGFVAGVVRDGAVDSGAVREFLHQTKRAYFAFGCDETIKQLVADIYRQAILLQVLQAKQKVLAGDAVGNNLDKQGEVLQWFNATLDSLEKRFEVYLRLEH